MIKTTAQILFGYTVLLSVVLFFTSGQDSALSCFFGGLIMLVNLLGIYFLWHLVFSKKSIALAVFVIIFKYLILGVLLWNLAKVSWMKPVGLILGLSTLVFAILSTTLLKSFVKTNKTLKP